MTTQSNGYKTNTGTPTPDPLASLKNIGNGVTGFVIGRRLPRAHRPLLQWFQSGGHDKGLLLCCLHSVTESH
jgi:hypothetical protein